MNSTISNVGSRMQNCLTEDGLLFGAEPSSVFVSERLSAGKSVINE